MSVFINQTIGQLKPYAHNIAICHVILLTWIRSCSMESLLFVVFFFCVENSGTLSQFPKIEITKIQKNKKQRNFFSSALHYIFKVICDLNIISAFTTFELRYTTHYCMVNVILFTKCRILGNSDTCTNIFSTTPQDVPLFRMCQHFSTML